jgi:flagellar basal body-associated protein FliL
VKISDCRVLTETAEDEGGMCKEKSVGERRVSLCVVVLVMIYICLLQLVLVHFTFTQKQCTEQHNETEYTEYYIHNNKNT